MHSDEIFYGPNIFCAKDSSSLPSYFHFVHHSEEKEGSSLVFDLGCCTLVCAMCIYDAENIVIFGEKEIVYC